ncbi:unnamed protein product [Cyclocybe aegerita]|uniref:Uncharacterized protein n=1 Tax=Cyclocybe aegerita TaxID=1973307 RepID=A0A8S0W142_CYCAE|nr:unnamed protein product [Cyclocybe aegerita]
MTVSCRSGDQDSFEPTSEADEPHNVYYAQDTPTTKAQFPYFRPIKACAASATVYCRSLMSAGNGFPPFDAIDDQSPASHIERGAGIGDVGYIDSEGTFVYCFNIFYPSDHPIQEDTMPREFVPIEPPLADWEVRTSQDHYPPGSVVAGEGVSFTSISQSPLKIAFSTSAREGAVLVLPEGNTRRIGTSL